jgi:hypothetical protein
VRDNLRSFELLWRQLDHMARYRLPVTEDICRYGRGSGGSISKMDVVDIGDVRHVSDVRDIDLTQVIGAVMVPREIRLSRS